MDVNRVHLGQPAIPAHMRLMEARVTLEVQNAMLAAQRRTDEELAHMLRVVRCMRRKLTILNAYIDLDLDLHLRIARATHNLMLAELLETLRPDMRAVMYDGLSRCWTLQQREHIQGVHEALIEQSGQRDAEAAGKLMRLHFSEAIVRLGGAIAP